MNLNPMTRIVGKVVIFSCLSITMILGSNLYAKESGDEVDDRLMQILKRFPEADANGDGVLTRQEAAAFFQQRRNNMNIQNKNPLPTPTHANVKYGDHELQAFDIWIVDPKEKSAATPLCIFIHGGGFRGGDKSRIQGAIIQRFLDNGISFVSMNYRLTDGGKYPYPAAMHDCVRGLQLIRSRATEWKIDPEKIACYGGSAGAGISLWIALHDDLADPESDDPVARQTTRILAAGTMNGQSTYDIRTFREWFGVPDLSRDAPLVDFYAMKEGETFDTPRVAKLAEQASPITHLTKDDPPVFMFYSRQNSKVTSNTDHATWVHHPLLGLKLQEAMKKLNLECVVVAPDIKDTAYEDIYDFLIKKLSN